MAVTIVRRGPLYAILVSLALLLQAATATFAFKDAGHRAAQDCGRGQVLRGAASISPDVGGDAGQAPKQAHDHCAWCVTGASMPAPEMIFVTTGAAEFSTRLYFKNRFQPRSNSRIEPNAAPRAPPALA